MSTDRSELALWLVLIVMVGALPATARAQEVGSSAPAGAGADVSVDPTRQFMEALRLIDAGKLSEAQASLEALIASGPPAPLTELAQERLAYVRKLQQQPSTHLDETRQRLQDQQTIPFIDRGRGFVTARRIEHPTSVGFSLMSVQYDNSQLPPVGIGGAVMWGEGVSLVGRRWLQPWLAVGGDLVFANVGDFFRGVYTNYNNVGVHAQALVALPLRLTPVAGLQAGYEIHKGSWLDLGGDYCLNLSLWKGAASSPTEKDEESCARSERNVEGHDRNDALVFGPQLGLLWTVDVLEISAGAYANIPAYRYQRTYTINEQVEDLSQVYEVPEGRVLRAYEWGAGMGISYTF